MCTPSRWEGFGFVFVEAAACESMIVTSNIAPMNEYLKDGENAFLIEEFENAKILAEVIFKACKSDTNKIKKNAREVGVKFEKKLIDKQELELMENVNNLYIDEGVAIQAKIMVLFDYFKRRVKIFLRNRKR